jgi:hypothetical protein
MSVGPPQRIGFSVKHALFAVAAIVTAAAGGSHAQAQASNVDLVQNGYFNQVTNPNNGSGNGSGGYYTGSGPAPEGSQEASDWSACVLGDCGGVAGYPFLFIATPGVADGNATGPATGFADPWDNPAGPGNSSSGLAYRALWGAGNGGVGQNGSGWNAPSNGNAFNGYGPGGVSDTNNFLIADGDYHRASIGQLITGLHVGDRYALTFDWAAGQWSYNSGNTTERFQVGFGSDFVSTPTYLLESHSFSGWMEDTLTFTATSTSEMLSFLAIGTPGGEPPMLLLDDVAMYDTPEPGALALLVVGLGALGVAARRRRAK